MKNDPLSNELLKTLIDEQENIVQKYENEFKLIVDSADLEIKEFIEHKNKIKAEAIRNLQDKFEANLKLIKEKIKELACKDLADDIFEGERFIRSCGTVKLTFLKSLL